MGVFINNISVYLGTRAIAFIFFEGKEKRIFALNTIVLYLRCPFHMNVEKRSKSCLAFKYHAINPCSCALMLGYRLLLNGNKSLTLPA